MLRRRPIARRAVRTAAVVGTVAAVGGHMANKGQQQAAPEGPPPAEEPMYEPAPSAGPTPENIEQLKALADLKDQGILSEEEFAAEKAKILNS